jgi:hypothetical protein
MVLEEAKLNQIKRSEGNHDIETRKIIGERA